MEYKDHYFNQLLQSLELDKILYELSQYSLSEIGKRRLSRFLVFKNPKDLEVEITKVKNYQFLQNNQSNFPLNSLYEIAPILENVDVENFWIDSINFIKIKKIVENIRDIKLFLDSTDSKDQLSQLITRLNMVFFESSIIKLIQEKMDDEGIIYSTSSPELLRIRTLKSTIYTDIDTAFKSQLSKYKQLGYLSDTLESHRLNRRVLAVWAEHKRKVKGILIDESETGKIVYIEPAETIYLNNEAQDLDRDEQKEIKKILIDLTSKISKYKKLLLIYQEVLAELDVIQAKARFSKATQGHFPKISATNTLKIVDGYHPILKIKNSKIQKPTIPFSLTLTPYQSTMLISGPNAGGKTICLKAVGLLSILFQMAIPIPLSSESEIPIFDQFFGDMGDQQSLEDELSTYSSKLKLWKFIMENSTSQSLILFDEMGTGTDPTFGATMAQVVLEKCIEKKAISIATTHFGQLKKFGDEHKSVLNASMMFDEILLEPMYRLQVGMPGSSYTFHIARKMQMNPEIIQRAENLSHTDQLKYDDLLLKLEIKNKNLVKQKNELDQSDKVLKEQIKKWKNLNNELDLLRKKVQYDKMLFNHDVNINKEKEIRVFTEKLKKESKNEVLIEERKKIQQDISLEGEELKQSFKQIHQIDPNQEIKIGQKVQYIQTQSIGTVEKIERKKAIVSFEHNKLTVPIFDLIIVKNQSQDSIQPNHRKIQIEKKTISNELDLRGMYVMEALEEFELFINNALMDNKYECKIIHGRGPLKKEILKSIKSIRNITKYTHGDPNGEGDGVTYIYF